MSADELNFKKMSTEKYRVYRLLQSPTTMLETYRARVKAIGNYRGAVIFPEQFISLYGQAICKVQIVKSQDKVSCSAVVYRNFSLMGHGHSNALRTFDDVLDVERKCSNSGVMERMFTIRLTTPKYDRTYNSSSSEIDVKYDTKNPTYWFSNKADGLAYIRKNLVL